MNRLAAALFAVLCAAGAAAQTVSMGGSLGSNALLVIDGKARTVAIGATVDGIRLISVTGNEAVVELKGKRVLLRLGDAQVNLGGKAAGTAALIGLARCAIVSCPRRGGKSWTGAATRDGPGDLAAPALVAAAGRRGFNRGNS